MIRIFANANYDFLSVRKTAYIITAAIAIPGLPRASSSPAARSFRFGRQILR
jgi:hypothetical protein